MDCMKLRHLDGLYGYFVVVDGKMFNSHAYGQEAKSFPHMVTSTVKVFVQQSNSSSKLYGTRESLPKRE